MTENNNTTAEVNIKEELYSLLKQNENFANSNNELLRDNILLKDNRQILIELLLSNNNTKEYFFDNINGTLIFKENEFIKYLKQRDYLSDSYTEFDNKIGFNIKKELDKNIVLEFPYKDCILEGGQTKDDKSKRKEIFFNEILAKNEIKRLFEAKVLTNLEIFGGGMFNGFNRDKEINKKRNLPEDTITDNLLIKGNNLVALYSLAKEFRGKVKLIYIDPPYNTGNDDFTYNDNFNHSTWLCFMKNRLEIARELLAEDGSIYIQMDVGEAHYLKILLDEIFGRNNFRSEIIWDTSIPYVAGNKWLSNNWIYSHSIIFYYAKNSNLNRDNSFNKLFFEVKQPSGDISKKPYKDIWCDIENFAGFLGAKDIKLDFKSRKPEKLIQRIIQCSTNPHDIVLDFFAGSGTTGAVAHKMNRQWIMVEQMDYIDTITKRKIKKVVEGEQGGISKSVEWKGGGEFVYMELKKYNKNFVDMLGIADTKEKIVIIFNEICEKGFVKYNVDIKELKKDIENENSEFLKLPLEDMKERIYNILNKNMLYVPVSMLNDSKFENSDVEKKITRDFYKNL